MRPSMPFNSRRVVLASMLLGIFVLSDIALFGWLIFRSLSKREVERVLLETRLEAESLAQRLAGRAARQGEDLYTATATEREVQTYIDSILKQRKFVQTVEVFDSEGRLVFRGVGEATFELRPTDSPIIETGEAPSRVEIRPFERQRTFPLKKPVESLHELNLPIGELGFLHVGISQAELQRSIGTLRSDLIRTTALIAGFTLGVLMLAYLLIWRLWIRGQQLEEQARESDRMAYIGTLASGLAHEIRNPLNSLNLNMQMLEEEMTSRPVATSGRRLMAITRDEIHRLERLVTEFLQYAKPPPLDLEVVPAVGVLERCRQVLAGELGARGASIIVEDRSGGAQVRVDVEQMNQLLLNLVQNALAAMEDGDGPVRVWLRVLREGGDVVLEVEDRGTGLSLEDQEKMFDLFYSTRKGGTGLGLAVVQRIARSHGARLEVNSSLGKGTVVRVRLQEASAAGDRGSTERNSAPASARAAPLSG